MAKRETKDGKVSVRTPAVCRAKRDKYGGCRHSRRRIKHTEDCTHDRPKVKQTWNKKTKVWDKGS